MLLGPGISAMSFSTIGELAMTLVLFIIAAVLVIAGIGALLKRQFLYGGILIVLGLLIGPGGVSIFT